MSLPGGVIALASAFALAASNVVVRKALLRIGSRACAAVTVASAIPLLVVAAAADGELGSMGSLDMEDLAMLAVSGLFTFVVGRILYYQSMQRIGANRSNSFISTYPTFATVLGVAFLGEQVSPAEVIGIAIVLAGVVLVSESGGQREGPSSPSFRSGAELALVAAALAGAGQFLVKGAVAGTALPVASLLVSYAAAMLVLLPMAAVPSGLGPAIPGVSTVKEALLLAVSAGALSALGHALRYTALESSSLALVSSLASVEPLFVVMLSFMMIKSLEDFNARVVAGAGLVVSGVLTITLVA